MELKKADDRKEQINVLRRIWYTEVIPLLQEYFYNDWEKLKFVLGDFVREINLKKFADNELISEDEAKVYEFVELQGEDFVNALIKIAKENRKSSEGS